MGSQVIIVVKASEETDFMNETTSKLSSLLSYWLEHNQEHGAEFREWADKIAAAQKDVAGQLRQAADKMAEADEYLKQARSLLK
jgi:2-succinyl-5-enolpyruvyl-6-hydroxy-3-cyclohexene-1-carboxylate synthase